MTLSRSYSNNQNSPTVLTCEQWQQWDWLLYILIILKTAMFSRVLKVWYY
jgi:hypothetical protein